MLNECNFIGNLGRDPEIRHSGSGDKIVNLSLAVSEKWKDKNGEAKEKTEWVKIVVYKKLADVCEKYLSKGSKIYAKGKMQTRKWEDNSGNTRYSTEIILQNMEMLDSKKSNEQGSYKTEHNIVPDDMDDEIPF